MIDFSRLGSGFDAAIIGASGGIGGALVSVLAAHPDIDTVHALSRTGRVGEGPRIRPARIDIEDEGSIAEAARLVGEETSLRLVIIATGLLHDAALRPEKTWRDLSAPAFARAFEVNATGPALVAKHFLPLLPRREPAVFAAISARVGSISDNRAGGWYAYRASKAALNQVLKCLAIEEGRRRPELVVAGLQPGTVRTALSSPFRGAVSEEALLDPSDAAEGLLSTVARLTPSESGRLFDWRGEEFFP